MKGSKFADARSGGGSTTKQSMKSMSTMYTVHTKTIQPRQSQIGMHSDSSINFRNTLMREHGVQSTLKSYAPQTSSPLATLFN